MTTLHLTKLHIYNLRNLRQVAIEPSPKLNIFFGNNGQGKTNLLESISLSTFLKPIRPIKTTRDLIHFEQSEAKISAHFKAKSTFDVALELKEMGRRALLCGKPLRDASRLADRLCLVSFVPDDLYMIMGGSSFRRKALDQLTMGLFPSFLFHTRRYDRALLQRNQLLKRPFVSKEELHAFTLTLAEEGGHVIRMRLEALAIWEPYFHEALAAVSETRLVGNVGYISSGVLNKERHNEAQVWSEHLMARFTELSLEERRRRTSLAGPHLDDLQLHLNGQLARHTASRGQARALVLAFKIAQLRCVGAHRELSPLFLLDDVISELDPFNAKALLGTLQALDCQSFITTTHLDALPFSDSKAAFFELVGGEIR